ncbi:DUF5684 domain-containing protein [Leucobacter luti]|uniref:DUF5684 domain-containing protein n=1 Tax=Leucobacter luti TaxID=340320 RepID=UPI001C68A29B|nr:DUF5684 domain-containing protein [Leucobacter luti]QYM77035.1 FHA domain-containing protein [Leucobacter luti]
MDNDLGAGGLALLGPVLGVWGLVALVFYVWYLWALSKLFPYLGLPAAHGWIPIWNEWQLIRRAGLPGWTVLLALVPGLGIVTLVFRIMAIHRLNTEFGKTASYTILGVFLPPIWAMLLASHISDGAYAGASVYTGEVAFPPLAAPPTPPAQGGTRSRRRAHLVAGPAVTGPAGTRATVGCLAPAGSGCSSILARCGAACRAILASPRAPAAARRPHTWAEPTPQAVQPPAEAWAPQELPSSEPHVEAGHGLPPVPPGAMRATPETPQEPVARDPHAMNDWGFSSTTEGNYERLAAEQFEARPAAPLGIHQTPEPFAWPGDADVAPPVSAVPLSLPEPLAAVAPQPSTAEQTQAPVIESEPHLSSAPALADSVASPQPVAATPPVPPVTEHLPGGAAPEAEHTLEPAQSAEPVASIFMDPVAQTPVLLETPAVPTPAPAPAAAVAASAPASDAGGVLRDDDEISDHTVVVPKRARWGLELPDGDTIELVGDDVVVGRKPTPLDGSTVLVVGDPTRTLSKSHARLRRDGEGWTIEDLGSTNGIAVLDGAGNVTPLPSGEEFIAPERMVLGTLEVRLRRL